MTMPIGLFGVMPSELLIILLIIMVLFGGKKLPDLARSLGRSLGEFKKGKEEGEQLASDKVKEVIDEIKKEEAAKLEGPKADGPKPGA